MLQKYRLRIGLIAAAVLLVLACVPAFHARASADVNAQIDFATTTTCPACGTTGVTWQQLPKASSKTTLAVGGHYYVPAGGLENDSLYTTGAKGKYCVHLNGQSISAKGTVINVTSNAEVHFFGSGTVTGNTGKTENLQGSVATITTAKLFLHGGTFTTAGVGNTIHLKASESWASYGQLHLYDGATISGGKTTTADLGGNVHVEVGDFTMHGGTITGGSAKSGGNLYTKTTGTFTMQGGTITDGNASADGGNVYLRKGATLSGGSITNGTAGNMGGNLLLRSATYKLTGVNITGGKAGSGGNVMLYGEAAVTLSAGKVEAGVATYTGGNFYVANEKANLTLTGGTVSDGSAVKGGNAYIHLGTLTVNGGTVQNGSATSGGNVYLRTNMNVQSGSVTGGSATDGGNIYIYAAAAVKDADGKVTTEAETNKAVLTVSGGKISKGVATAAGGNVYSSGYSGNNMTITMTGGSIEEGTAKNGGGLYLSYTKMTQSVGTITGGTADSAGNVYTATGGQFTMSGGTVTKGTVTGNGGNFYMSSTNSRVTIQNGTVSEGAADAGGNFYSNNGYLTITGGTVTAGEATNGGNIYNRVGSYDANNKIVINDVADDGIDAPSVTNGVVTKNGGNLYIDGNAELGSCNISGGQAKTGPQMYWYQSSKVKILSSFSADTTVYLHTTLVPSPVYGGAISGCSAEGTFPGQLVMTNDAARPGLVGKEGDTGLYVTSAALVAADGTHTWYLDNATMMAAYTDDVFYVRPAEGEFSLNGQNVLVDLGGQNVSFTGTGSVTCVDSANDYYRYCGSATFGDKVTVQNAPLTKFNNKQYYALNEDGVWSFRRMELVLNSVSLRPGTGGIYYTGKWNCDSHLQQYIKGFGVAVSVKNMPGADFATEAEQDNMWTEFAPDQFQNGVTCTGAIIERIVKDPDDGADADRIAKNSQYGQMPIYAVAYVLLEDGCYVSEGAAYSLRDVLNVIDANINQYSGYAKTMREFMEHWSAYGLTGENWEFSFSVSEDVRQLNALYNGTQVLHGEMHDHANTGGTSDGKVTLDKWVEGMEKLDMSFATIVDHKQVLHMQLPEWDNSIFVGGTELSVNVTDSGGKGNFHYNMIFSDWHDLENVLFAFPELEYKLNEETGEWHFIYPKMTRARMVELIACIRENNGQFVHVHPKYDNYLKSDDPLVYWFADYTGLEINTGSGGNMNYKDNQEAYELWTALLSLGKKVYATSGSDKHSSPNTSALTTMYAGERSADAYLANMRSGNFTAGFAGIRMAVGNAVMGGETSFAGQRLVVSVGDFHYSVVDPTHTYKMEIYQDDQVIYTASVDPNETLYYAMDADADASFYRVVIWDETAGIRIAVGNPIWNVK